MKSAVILFFLLGNFQLAIAKDSIPLQTDFAHKIIQLEKTMHGQIGVYAIDTNSKKILYHRENARFPFQSTMKLLVAGAVLDKARKHPDFLKEVIHYKKSDLAMTAWNPVSSKYLHQGMSVVDMAEAATTYSDNGAANILIKKCGGPLAISQYARAIGNSSFQESHYEGFLNSNYKISADTATPKDMALTVQNLVLGSALSKTQRSQLKTWMVNNTTGYKRMRAGVPLGWTVADKTGTGDFGVANDIGVLWSNQCKPIVLAIYTLKFEKKATADENIIAEVTKIAMNEFQTVDPCFQNR